ncbi:hypothetical protein V1519DRAFT_488555 [Lipomyces tetrasporus]
MATDPDYTRTPNLEQRATVLRTEIFNSCGNISRFTSLTKQAELSTLGSTTMRSTYGKYSKSSKDPDGSFMYEDDDKGPLLLVAIEVGFSKDHPGLRRYKDMWIKGYNAKVVILVCFRESPRFKNPEIAYEDIDDVDLELARMGQSVAKARRRNLEQGAYGPMEHRNHRWFGKLEDAFVEIWRADIKRPFRTVLIENGRRKVRLPTTFGLEVREFFDVRLDLDRYLQSLLSSVEMTAVQRFADFIVFS